MSARRTPAAPGGVGVVARFAAAALRVPCRAPRRRRQYFQYYVHRNVVVVVVDVDVERQSTASHAIMHGHLGIGRAHELDDGIDRHRE